MAIPDHKSASRCLDKRLFHQAGHFRCPKLHIWNQNIIFTEQYRARFKLANYLIEERLSSIPPDSVSLTIEGYEFTISPIDDYYDCIMELERTGGVRQTAWLEVRRANTEYRESLSLADTEGVVSELVIPLSLANGSLACWQSYTTFNAFDDHIRTVHAYTVSRSFSSFAGIELNLWADSKDICSAWFAVPQHGRLSRHDLVLWIRSYLESCVRETFPQTRGLTVAALLDAITYRYTEEHGESTIVPKEDWKLMIAPLIDSLNLALTDLHNISEESKSLLANKVRGVNGKNFRQRFVMMVEELNLDAVIPFVGRIIETRNELIHSGRFPSDYGDENYDRYVMMLWTAWAVLVRLCGYMGNFATPTRLLPARPTFEELRWLKRWDIDNVNDEDGTGEVP